MAKPLRVLNIEDSEDDAALLAIELKRGGYDPAIERVDTAAAMSDALDRQAWDVVIADYAMPQFSALAALALMQKKGYDLPFIILSGVIGEDTAVAAMKAGAHDYIMKGNMKRLVPAIERELREVTLRQERRRALEDLAQSEDLFRKLVENIREVFWMTNSEKDEMIYVSPAYEEIWCRTCESLYQSPQNLLNAIHPDDRERVLKSSYTKQVTGEYIEEYRIVRPDGSIRWILDRAFPIQTQSGKFDRIVGIAEDITDRKENEAAIRHMAYYDQLTGLPNRGHLVEQLERAILIGPRRNKPVALLLLDLDCFKEVNNTLGHDRGDFLLRQVGLRLKNVAISADHVARLGGDKFALMLPSAGVAEATRMADKVMKTLEKPFEVEDLTLQTESSIGIAVYPDHGQDSDTLIQRADVAMYEAKQTRSGYKVYNAAQDRHSTGRLALMGELRHAIEEKQLLLHYQPKVNLQTNRITGVEALVRWQHPKLGMVPPVQFILPAEQTGMIKSLTQWVLQEALSQSRRWQQDGLWINLSVNLSARNLQDTVLPGQIARLLQTYGITPSSLEVEITESAIMTDEKHARDVLTEIGNMGISISIDDF
ncbi:MAG: putative bifunctional diguanylate cyclase/phosphodiesterase, partial [Nitrospiria bacterium]